MITTSKIGCLGSKVFGGQMNYATYDKGRIFISFPLSEIRPSSASQWLHLYQRYVLDADLGGAKQYI